MSAPGTDDTSFARNDDRHDARRGPTGGAVRRARRALLGVVLVALFALVAGPVGVAMAEGASVTIASPHSELVTNNSTPRSSAGSQSWAKTKKKTHHRHTLDI